MRLRFPKRRLVVAFVAFVAATVATVVAGFFGAESYARRQVAAQLTELNGGPVQFDRVALGWNQLVIFGVKFHEPASAPAFTWCSIDRIWMDLSLWDGLRGVTTCDRMVLHTPSVHLRFSADGKLLTQFNNSRTGLDPPANDIDVRDASLQIEQAARTPFVVSGVRARATRNGDKLQVQGAAGELFRSEWLFAGAIDLKSFAASGKLSSDDVRLTTADWDSLPLLDLAVPRQIDLAISGGVKANGQWSESSLKYEAEFRPAAGDGSIDDREFSTRFISGVIVANNEGLTASNLRGTLSGGEYAVEGAFDWNRAAGSLEAKFADLRTDEVHKTWNFPKEVSATLDGQSQVSFARAGAVWRLQGRMEAHAREFSWCGLDPQNVTLTADFQYPPTSDAVTPFGMDGLAHIHAEAKAIDAARWRTAAAILPELLPATFRGNRGDDTTDTAPAAIQWLLAVDGAVSCDVDVDVPLATLNQLGTLRGTARVSSRSLRLFGLEMANATADIQFAAGVVEVSQATAEIRDPTGRDAGQVAARATLALDPLGELAAAVELKRISIPAAVDIARTQLGLTSIESPTGLVDATLHAVVPVQAFSRLDAWRVSGELTSPSVTYDEMNIGEASANCEIQQGNLLFRDAEASVWGSRLHGAGTLKLAAPFAFAVDGSLDEAHLDALVHYVPNFPAAASIAGRASANGEFAGQLFPIRWSGSGDGTIHAARVMDVDLGDPHFDWRVDAKAARVTDLTTTLFGGATVWQASYPFEDPAGSTLNAKFTDFQVGEIAGVLPASSPSVSGQISGELQLRAWHLPRQASGEMEFRSERINSPASAFSRVVGRLELADQELSLVGSATALDGRIDLSGNSSISALVGPSTDEPAARDRFAGAIKLQQLPIERLLQATRREERLKPLSGTVAADLKIRIDSNWRQHATGQVALHDVRWLRQPWSRDLQGPLTMAGDAVRLGELTGDFAGGRVRVLADLVVGRSLRGTFRVALEGGDASIALVPLPSLASSIQGSTDVRLQGSLGEPWSGRGNVAMTDARILGLAVPRLRAPVDFTFSPLRGQLRLRAPSVAAQVARGQVSGRVDVNWGRQLALDSDVRVKDVELRSLLRDAPGVGSVGGGRISGSAQLGGRRIASVNDLSGRFEADLSRLQPLQFPVLRQLGRYLGSVQPTTSFETGRAKGRLARGTLHFEETTIDGGLAQIMFAGTATLGGRLDLDVTAKTGDLNDLPAGMTRLVESPISLAAPLPVSLLVDVNEFLADRLVYLHVGGTVKRPAVRVQPARQLQEEALQFFLRRAANAAIDN